MTATLSVDALSTFYEMAREGAGLAADRLTRLTGVDTRVSVSRLDFATAADLRSAVDAGQYDAGIRVDLSGGLEGTSVMLFDEAQARSVAHDLVVDVAEPTDQLIRAAVTETCQIMNSGFVDGWADVLRAEVDVSTPEYVSGDDVDDLLDPVAAQVRETGLALFFRNRIETADGTAAMAFEHCLVPDMQSAGTWFLADGDGGIPSEKLAGFDRMAQQGADEVATNLTTMTGIGMSVEIRRVNFVSLDAIPESVPTEPQVGVAFGFDGVPSGYLLFLFDEVSAGRLSEATVGESFEGGRLTAAGRDAVQEVCNVMASRLLDGWANLLDGAIDHTPPAYCHDLGPAVVDPLIVGLSAGQEFAFVFDTRVRAVGADGATPEGDPPFDVDIYVIPEQGGLEEALDRLDVSEVGDAATTADVRFGDLRAADVDDAGPVDAGGLVESTGDVGDGTGTGTGTTSGDAGGRDGSGTGGAGGAGR